MDQPLATGEAMEKLRHMMRSIDLCMMTTRMPDGTLRSRPMSNNGEVEPDGDMWFFTDAGSSKVDELQAAPEVNVSFVSSDRQQFVSLSGRASLVRDAAKIRELWRPTLKAWFAQGPDTPGIALVRVSAHHAEYWDGPGRIATAIGLVKAAVTGEQYDGGENRKLRLD